ncbi:MAG TPA: hypothetical protein VLL52_01165 [Anaerolineae bacterium]|nr:hypothetical protein [Anaerolineae bacterium]
MLKQMIGLAENKIELRVMLEVDTCLRRYGSLDLMAKVAEFLLAVGIAWGRERDLAG